MSEENVWDEVGGDSHEAIKWAEIPVGTWVSGTILDKPSVVTRPSLSDGTPEKQLAINLETKDGPRTLWVIIKKGFLSPAIKKAALEAGGGMPDVGGKLAVRVTELRDTGKPKPARIFEAKYEPPKTSVEDVFGKDDEEPF